ncbi:unnamed protein product [Phytomonas sp. Hart1]|nr:unnamed protein product [Phytomonas sp. Hart1]|eukprot:CCW67550.1 unnamed protein product [Phytomonas sp. isolate Hart1]
MRSYCSHDNESPLQTEDTVLEDENNLRVLQLFIYRITLKVRLMQVKTHSHKAKFKPLPGGVVKKGLCSLTHFSMPPCYPSG